MKKYFIFILFNILFFYAQTSIFAQGITIYAKVDSANILIGDQVKYIIELTKPINENISSPAIKDTIIKEIEVLESYKPDTSYIENNHVKLRYSYLITSFDSGQYVIPPHSFLWSKNEKIDTLFSNQVFLNVYTIPIDTTQMAIMDIKAPIDAPFSIDEIYPYLFWILLGMLILAAIIYVLNKIRKKEPLIKIAEKPKIPPHITALSKLEELEKTKLWQNQKIKKYHIELTNIIREYIEDRFNYPAMEEISSEIIKNCDTNEEISQAARKAIKQILPLSDLVKFAKFEPLPNENDACLKNAYIFVNETIPKPKIELEPPKNNNLNDNNNVEPEKNDDNV